jgi:ABC-type dipeptide/oligopeptide/nickel transport system permease component
MALRLSILVMQKIVAALALLLLISLFVFVALSLVPGDPALQLLGQSWTPEAGAALRAQLGLDDPRYVQFGRFLWNALQGDLGRSYMTVLPVSTELVRALGLSLRLASMAILLSSAIGVPLGILAALRRNSWVDVLSRTLTVVLSSVPTFVVGILAIYVFAAQLRLLPSGGVGGLRHMLLPALTLSLFSSAGILRMTRASLLEVLRQDYIKAAQARGIAFRRIVLRYALRNAAIPLLTLGGLYIGTMIATAVITEYVFAWPGLGTLTITAIQSRDIPMIRGGILATAVTYIAINSLIDILYGVIDPRLRTR